MRSKLFVPASRPELFAKALAGPADGPQAKNLLPFDLRKQIAVKLQAGQNKQEIIDFMVARYGEFVLYRPALNARTVLLWVGPFALLLVAVAVLTINIRRRRAAAAATEWTADNAQRARALLSEGDERS